VALEKSYLSTRNVTHLHAGWVAFDNGSLYHCSLDEDIASPQCVKANGLPDHINLVSRLWGNEKSAWVVYTNGRVYGCRLSKLGPECVAAEGVSPN